jgi:hypothetical protein
MRWCEMCQENIFDEEVELECMYPDCPMPARRAVDTGDASPTQSSVQKGDTDVS